MLVAVLGILGGCLGACRGSGPSRRAAQDQAPEVVPAERLSRAAATEDAGSPDPADSDPPCSRVEPRHREADLAWPPDRDLRRQAPPKPRTPAGQHRALRGLEVLLREQGPAVAQAEARRLHSTRALGPEHLAAVAFVCAPCGAEAVMLMRRQAEKRGWAWTEARALLPLLGHPAERLRASALVAFQSAATKLSPGPLKKRLESHLPVFRSLAVDPSSWVRAEALLLLGHLRDRRAHALMTARLTDPWPVVRVAAVEAVARAVTLVPGAPSTRAVCLRLTDESPAVRAATLEALAGAPGACPLGEVAPLLEDRSRVRLRLLTEQSGHQGLWRSRGEVRHAAFVALPPALRVIDPVRPWDLKIADAQGLLAREGVLSTPKTSLVGAPRGAPRSCRPLAMASSEGGGIDGGSEGEKGAPQGSRRASLASHPAPEILEALRSLQGRPLTGLHFTGLVGLLAHGEAEVRLATLHALDEGTLDDDKWAVLCRALWLARRDPHPLVRQAALSLVVSLHGALTEPLEAALQDPHPALRMAAVEHLAAWDPALGRVRLPTLLSDASPAVRATALYWLLRDAYSSLPRDTVVAALDDAGPAWVHVPHAGRASQTAAREEASRRVDPGFGTVRGAVLMALEARWGVRHQGSEAERARRWQDDLRLGEVVP